jgi:hypothetical protein
MVIALGLAKVSAPSFATVPPIQIAGVANVAAAPLARDRF